MKTQWNIGPSLRSRLEGRWRRIRDKFGEAMQKLYMFIYKKIKDKSFKNILIAVFLFISIVPLLVLQVFSYNRLSENLQGNMNQLSQANVAQISSNLHIIFESYEDLLYQIYTNDDIISLSESIDRGENAAFSANQLQRTLQGLCYAKDGIEAISIITAGGNAIYYDKLTAASVRSSWLGKDNITEQIILEAGFADFTTKLLPSYYVYSHGSREYYLFHMMHRLIDYRYTNKEIGVVVLSLNEDILQEACNPDLLQESVGFIISKTGRVISYPDKSKIGLELTSYDGEAGDLNAEIYRELFEEGGPPNDHIGFYSADTVSDWRVVTAVDQSGFHEQIRIQMRNSLIIGVIILDAAAFFILIATTMLSKSMDRVSAAMSKAREGDLYAFVDERYIFSSEITTIVRTYNQMMEQIIKLIDEVRLASRRQRDAEIKALEAQINPHFLYNTLDSMNWIAIDNEQYEISQMISSLAKILRYSINNSNAVVPLSEEIEWMRQYIYLQRVRFKNNFDYTIDAEEQILNYPVHKLMLQPFIENSIIHGFKTGVGKNLLQISAKQKDGLQIIISDNGRGYDTSAVKDGNHIGLDNAMSRIRIYYGDSAEVQIISEPGEGTTIIIQLPLHEEGVG